MRLTIEIDDNELRRVIAPLFQFVPPEAPSPEVSLLTVRQVAGRLGISHSKTYSLITRGEIASVTIGRSRRISPAALSEFIARSQAESLGAPLTYRQTWR